MTLNELFPKGSYNEVSTFLANFDLLHKMPKNLDTIISLDERGLSPGETQSLDLASQLWKAKQLNSPFLLLDEPERNIDLETVKKIFDNILCMYDGIIFLTTHLPDLKIYLQQHIKETWNYKPNNGCDLSFTISNPN